LEGRFYNEEVMLGSTTAVCSCTVWPVTSIV